MRGPQCFQFVAERSSGIFIQRRQGAVSEAVVLTKEFYDFSRREGVGKVIGEHAVRVTMRAVALALSAGMALIVWKFASAWEALQRRTLVWLALFAMLYTGIPPVKPAVQERRPLARVSAADRSPNFLVIIVDTLCADQASFLRRGQLHGRA